MSPPRGRGKGRRQGSTRGATCEPTWDSAVASGMRWSRAHVLVKQYQNRAASGQQHSAAANSKPAHPHLERRVGEVQPLQLAEVGQRAQPLGRHCGRRRWADRGLVCSWKNGRVQHGGNWALRALTTSIHSTDQRQLTPKPHPAFNPNTLPPPELHTASTSSCRAPHRAMASMAASLAGAGRVGRRAQMGDMFGI